MNLAAITVKRYDEKKFKEKFQLSVISDSDISSSAETFAKANRIHLVKRNQLIKLIQDVIKHEAQRLKTAWVGICGLLWF